MDSKCLHSGLLQGWPCLAHSIAPLALFVTIATLSPGGATTLATASGARFGFIQSTPLLAGIAVGLGTLAAAAAAGLAGILLAAPSLQTGMKVIGSAYLLWLAVKIARSGPPAAGKGNAVPATFVGGACLLWLNPKGWAMALGAAASFAMLSDGLLHLAALLGGAFALAACVSLSIWCAAGVMFARLLKTPRQWRLLNGSMALLLAVSIIPMWR
ncbi:MAG: LysE family translocator [Pseudomonadota bacterium]|nr:LysE family translocator [Pseudomonadota bacterium]